MSSVPLRLKSSLSFSCTLWGIGDSRCPSARLLRLAGSAAKIPAGLAQLCQRHSPLGHATPLALLLEPANLALVPLRTSILLLRPQRDTPARGGGNTVPAVRFSPAEGHIKGYFCPLDCLFFPAHTTPTSLLFLLIDRQDGPLRLHLCVRHWHILCHVGCLQQRCKYVQPHIHTLSINVY
jgi:hypothetical protein